MTTNTTRRRRAPRGFRTESDTMGPVRVPRKVLWGAQTQRALDNFQISGRRFSREFLRAYGIVKEACCRANRELKLLDARRAGAIRRAAREVRDGHLDEHFPLDVFQTGSGTSTNMNVNEVIANRAIAMLGGTIGSKDPIHPNDHVNKSQSTNDTFPTTIHVAGALAIRDRLEPALALLSRELARKARAFDRIVKPGRTHLQDATPVRLGQEFGGWARQIEAARERLAFAAKGLLELPLGGTAVGTGINRHPRFPALAIREIARQTRLPFQAARNAFEAQAAKDAVVATGAALRGVGLALYKVANDLRWMGSGPGTGLGEIELPALQPGSSIMPAKVNPVACEVAIQAAAHALGTDVAIAAAGAWAGNFELNVGMPLLAHHLLETTTILANAAKLLGEGCVRGVRANRETCRQLTERSLALVTALAPRIGYEEAAALAKESLRTKRTLRELVLEKGLLDARTLEKVLDVLRMTEPGIA